jgi:hypothetical protein
LLSTFIVQGSESRCRGFTGIPSGGLLLLGFRLSYRAQIRASIVAIDADKAIRLAIPYLRDADKKLYRIHRFSSGIGREYFFVIGGNLLNLHKPLSHDVFTEKYVGFGRRSPGENLPM